MNAKVFAMGGDKTKSQVRSRKSQLILTCALALGLTGGNRMGSGAIANGVFRSFRLFRSFRKFANITYTRLQSGSEFGEVGRTFVVNKRFWIK